MARFNANLEKEAFIREGEGFFLGKSGGRLAFFVGRCGEVWGMAAAR